MDLIPVLYLTSNPNRASSNVPTEGWFRRLPRARFKPVLVSHANGAFCEWTRSQEIPTAVIPLPFPNKWRPWSYLASLWKLRQVVLKSGIRLIHAIEHNVYPIAADLARVCDLPVLVGVHCRVERGFAEWAFNGRRQPTRLFFLTRGSCEACRPAFTGIVPEMNWRQLPNGVSLDQICPNPLAGREFREENQLGNGFLIGAASWLRPGKQLEHLFRVVAAIDDPNVTLVMAGGVAPGEEAYANNLIAHGHELLGPRFRYLGCLSDLRGFYNALDLYINTSLEESFGISVLESLACGCPVVGYDSGAINELVLPGGGEITPQDDIEHLTMAVRKWINDKSLRDGAKIAARRRSERFDIRRISEQLWQEYEEVLAERGRRRISRPEAAGVAG